MAKQETKVSLFVGLLVTELVGENRLINMSVTGKPCQRFRNKRNADGTCTHPPKEGLDPEVFNFICDKVAERAAIINGAENVALIRAASNETLIRGFIATKIQNLVKSHRKRARGLEKSGSG
ncbi:uncharacterized protein LOC128093686 [Culex pipiens pallens]|nr:uncharacterized protein LOC128093686 [Culex pipiens pallens]